MHSHAISYYLALFKVLRIGRLYNFIRAEGAYLFSNMWGRPVVTGMPWAASVEPTTKCNLHCPECPTGMQALSRPKGTMDVAQFRSILDRLHPNLFYLTLYFQGEPMLNPHFTDMVQLARSRRIFVSTSSNGHFLNEHSIARILQSGLNHLIISLDGIDQETYGKYRVNGNFDTVVTGLEQLLAARKALKSRTPYVELQFIVMKHNEHQVKQLKKLGRQLGVDKITFKTAQIYHLADAGNIVPADGSKARYRQSADGNWVLRKKIRNHCRRIWNSVVITWDGKLVPCCYDKNAVYSMGDLTQETLAAIWKNQRYQAFRKKVSSDRKGIEMCRNCGE